MLVTREQMTHRLQDGRWHQTTPAIWRWFGNDLRYEIQYRRRTQREWKPSDGPVLQANTLCRIRLRAEHLQPPFKATP